MIVKEIQISGMKAREFRGKIKKMQPASVVGFVFGSGSGLGFGFG